jgi:peptidoglycan/xylan/chitin deacetylase (PgdA/CDA1 family)
MLFKYFNIQVIIRRILSLGFYPFTALYNYFNPGIRILMYHRIDNTPKYDQLIVSPINFAKQMEFLAKNYRVISLEQAVTELKNVNNKTAGVVITFDDGYLDNFIEALPILRKYNLPATIFVTSLFSEQKLSHSRYKNNKQRLHMNWSEIRETLEDSNITIGSHTLSHPFLNKLSDVNSLNEIKQSKQIITEKLNRKINFFCYPSGNFDKREIKFVKEANYTAATSVAPGLNRFNNTSLFSLKRTEINDKDSLFDFKLKLASAYDPIHKILHLKRRHQFAKKI